MRIARTVLLAFGLGSAFGSGVGCFNEQLPPPTFRYECSVDSDCLAAESCRRGFCQLPCTIATTGDDCPADQVCFNGSCSSVCDVEQEFCPQPQTCIDLGVDLGIGGGGFLGGGGASTVGVCGELCDDADPDSCPAGELCVMGFCAQSCLTEADCTDGFVCLVGICAPDVGGLPTTSAGSTDSGGSTGAGSTGASSTDGGSSGSGGTG